MTPLVMLTTYGHVQPDLVHGPSFAPREGMPDVEALLFPFLGQDVALSVRRPSAPLTTLLLRVYYDEAEDNWYPILPDDSGDGVTLREALAAIGRGKRIRMTLEVLPDGD